MSVAEIPSPESLLPRFGLDGFRPGQREVIDAVLQGEDCLCIMPTGGGKSLCYQLPALALPGLTLVISPLIALMKDQVDQLQKLGHRATLINSTLDPAEQQSRLERVAAGDFDLVYVVPERFRSPRFMSAVKQAKLARLAIDEAHCVSEWGHDFRPDYARLGWFRQQMGNPPTIALTATATHTVREDIVRLLALREPRTFITGFTRPNLYYEVQAPATVKDKNALLLSFVSETPGSGIIYASSRKRCEEVAELINQGTRRRAGVYHAGMDTAERTLAQDAFMRGQTDIIVATTAFGMGIDKRDVRFVVHYNLPGTLEGYYQEAGRAGRDGQPAHCLLLFSQGDRFIQEFFIESAYPSREVARSVWDFMRQRDDDPIELTLLEIKELLGLEIGHDGVGTCLQLLEKSGVIQRLDAYQNMAVVRIDSELPTLVDLLPSGQKKRRRVLQAVEMLIGPRRGEMVYFQLRDLAARLEMEPTAVSQALRELRELKAFDYVPPFRGRAVHLLEPERRFETLSIDFEALETRKQAEYNKLEQMIGFCRTHSCRQLTLTRYFGEMHGDACGNCDNCRSSGASPQAPRQVAGAESVNANSIMEPVRMALAGVARTHGRFGKTLVAQMLAGSRNAKVTKFKLDRLTTYNLLNQLKEKEVVTLLDALIVAGFCEQEELDRFRPVLKLTPRGDALMRGESFNGVFPLPPDISEKLRQVAAASAKQAVKAAKVEAARAPAARESFVPEKTVRFEPDVGADLPADVNEAFAAAVDDEEAYDEAPATSAKVVPAPAPALSPAVPPSTPPAKAAPPSPAPASITPEPLTTGRVTAQPSHYWTWRLLAAGLTPGECAAARGLDDSVVLDHAIRAAQAGWPIDARWFIASHLLAAMQATIKLDEDPAQLRPVMARLPAGTRYEEVQLFLVWRRQRTKKDDASAPLA